jgi:hypothetical protein
LPPDFYFPIPAVPGEEQKPVEKLVERILAAKAPPSSNSGAASKAADADVRQLEQEIDELVYALHALTPEEIKIVESASVKTPA